MLSTAKLLLFALISAATAQAGQASGDPEGEAGAAVDCGEQEASATSPRGPEAEERPLNELTVVAKRLPEDPFESDRSVCVLERKALAERAPRTVPEALSGAPGVFVQKTNHGGGSPIVRGMIGPQNLVLVDGVRFNNSVYRTGPIQYLNLIDPFSIERIEVLRGPGSVLYGSDAMGGVVEVLPIAAREAAGDGFEAGGRAVLRYGSADRGAAAHGDLQLSTRSFSVLGGFSRKAFGDLSGGRGVGVQPHSGYDDTSAVGNLSYRFAPGWGFKAGYLMSRIDGAGRTDKLEDKRSLQLYDNGDDLAYGKLRGRLRAIRTRAELTLSYQRFREQKDNIKVSDDLATEISATRDEVRADTIGADLQLVSRLLAGRLRVQYGGMWYRDFVGADRSTRNAGAAWQASDQAGYTDGSTYDNLGGFLMVEGEPLWTEEHHILRLGAGYRLHAADAHAPDHGDLAAVDFGHAGHVFFGSLQYLYRDRATAGLTFSQGFRAPNLNEAVMLGDTGKYFHVPNSELGPERSDTIELVGRARAWRLRASVAGYVSFLHDLVKREETTWKGQAEVGDKPVAWNVNGGEGTLWGVEGVLGADLGRGFSAAGSLTYTWGEEDVPGGPNVPLTRIPPLFGQLTLRYETAAVGDLRGFVETSAEGAAEQGRLSAEDEKDVRIPEGGTPSWWTWNLRAGLQVHDTLTLGLVLENLLDKAYKHHGSGVYAPGTNAVLTVEADY